MKELAQVIECRGNKALVKVERHSACSKCEKDCGLAGSSHEIDEIEIEINNTLSANPGNIVKLEMSEKPLVLASFLVYILPLLGLIGGYFLTNWFFKFLGISNGELTGITGGLIFLLLSFWGLRSIDNKVKKISAFHPKMTEIVEK